MVDEDGDMKQSEMGRSPHELCYVKRINVCRTLK
jgi:hypothetical protein